VRTADALGITAMLAWGIAYVPSAWLVETWPPITAAGARLTLAGVLLLGLLEALGRPLRPGVGPATLGWLALTQTTVFYGAVFWGIQQEGAGLPAVLANTDPLFVAVLAAAFLGETLTGRQWTGLLVGLVGAAVVVWDGPLWPPALSTGAVVVIGGALAWSIGTVVATRGVRGRAEPLALAGWQMTVGGIVLAVAGIAGEGPPDATGVREVALIVLLATVGSALPLALFYIALMQAPAAEVSAWFFLVPVVGVLTAWPLLGETPTAQLLAGMAGVSAGLWLVLGRAAAARGRLVDSPTPP
jgi:drug/metabolite transporter (DMT)-like permease